MGVYDVIRRIVVESLTGIREEDVKSLCIRSQVLSDLAMRCKYADATNAAVVAANVRIINRLTTCLGYPRRKRGIPRVEIIQWDDKGGGASAPSPPVDEARSECLLAKITGPSIRAQLDIKRECLPSAVESIELPRKEQVFNLVPPNSVERVQPST